MRIASGLAMTFALSIGWISVSLAQGADTPGSTATTLVVGLVAAVVVVALVVVARQMATRRTLTEDAALLQSHLSDALARETQLHGSRITPRTRLSGWRRPQITIEIAGEVPTPGLRETAMRIARAETARLRPDVVTVDHLFIVPPVDRPSDSLAQRG